MDFKFLHTERFQKIVSAIVLLIIVSIVLKTFQYFDLCCTSSNQPHGFNKATWEHRENKRKQREFDSFAEEYIRKNIK